MIIVQPCSYDAQDQRPVIQDPTSFTEADRPILDLVRDGPVRLTTLVNQVAKLFPRPRKRQRRAVAWAILRRIGDLVRQGRLCRLRRILLCLPGYRPTGKLPACVIHLLAPKGGSTRARKNACIPLTPSDATVSSQFSTATVHSKPKPLPLRSSQTSEPERSATSAEISRAASALAQMPRKRRPWTGWLHGQRLRRMTPVVVPGGEVMPAYFVRRGKVYVLLPDEPRFAGRAFERFDQKEVKIYQSPDARLLGALKRGRREKPSLQKALAARNNGSKPPKVGSRPRGRPRAAGPGRTFVPP